MSKIIVQAGQTLLDIAIQYTGSEEGLPEIAWLNKISVTDDLTPGQELELTEVVDKRVRKVFTEGGFVPAAVIKKDGEGIGFWAIEYEFEVQ